MEIGREIKKIRLEKKISIQEVSMHLNWPVSKLSKIERGEQGINIDDLMEVARTLEVDISDIVYSDGSNNVKKTSESANDSVSIYFKNIAKNYLIEAKNDFSNNPIAKMIVRELPKLILNRANINSSNYLVSGSAGKGQFAEIPWIAVLKKSITETATKGVYLVYLFTADMKGLYLSLNQGFTYFKNEIGSKGAKTEIEKVSKYLLDICNTIPSNYRNSIDLKAVGPLGKGYMAGHIAGVYYDLNKIPDDNKLMDDLRNMMSVYEEISGIIGNRSIEEFYRYVRAFNQGKLIDENSVNEKINDIIKDNNIADEDYDYDKKPKDKKNSIKDKNGTERYPRDAAVSARALKLAGYACEIDSMHLTFTRKSSKKKYTEPHHLIPISAYNDFQYSLDVEENICSLCSNCHNCLHYGIDSEREPILRRLYDDRKELLEKAGIQVEFEELKNYYGIS
ncbi:DUF3578 domain-containing protein [Clostridium sp. YIM B02505]|uniref:DUF3578 domain-containing protein n=1 Tax=Clostridium yunnanense TaxID=2800325 RepID=A0ABS1EQ57_9CLOT|nr:DUF3578 domain-containing protein [Clostridium yunnanense]MBK1811537.1 DUF3578 domain-containing protein [Clostridium yunnanense]